jgi:methionyl-tRNA synthetase
VSFSRASVDWGIPVPSDPRYTIYVWPNELLNYITGAGYLVDDARFQRVWPADVHIIGKEIMKFHSLIWPAMLLGAGLKPPRLVFGHGWWTAEGQKMSKSLGNVVDPHELVRTFGLDATRYFLLREIPMGNDGDFSRYAFTVRTNTDLANNLGNLLNRSLTMVEKYCGGVVPVPSGTARDAVPMKAVADALYGRADRAMDVLAVHEALSSILEVTASANKWVDEAAPWALAKAGKQAEVEAVMYGLCESLRVATVYLKAFIPNAALEVWKQLGLAEADFIKLRLPEAGQWGGFPAGTRTAKGAPLFPRLELEKKP